MTGYAVKHSIRAEDIRILRKKLKLTQKDFAEIAHVPYSTLNNWGCMANGKIIQVPT